ncbi:MAG: UDP-N-acetylmuramoyl-tripeptide--D-alanyl-D-alanine ligase [Verrucomicrobiota bacterium]
MKVTSLQQVAEWAQAEVHGSCSGLMVERVHTDSRSVREGDLFIALRGERFDGHAYLEQAIQSGAVGLMVASDYELDLESVQVPVLQVEDTLIGLQQVASQYRSSCGCKVVAITGSSGKTSTKEMIAAVLSAQFKVQKTEGNLNNHIGLPMTLLSIEEDTEWAVVELGMNHPGEILPLAQLAQPDLAVITNIGWAHIEAFPDQTGIANEKRSILKSLSEQGIAVLNGDDPFLQEASEWTKGEIHFTGKAENALIRYRDPQYEDGKMAFKLVVDQEVVEAEIPYPGLHMVENATLAVGVGIMAEVSLADAVDGLKQVSFPPGRLQIQTWDGGWIIDDSYNANPDSMMAAFKTLSLLPGDGQKVALLGSMGELGAYSNQLHSRVGQAAVQEGIDELFCVGPEAEVLCQSAVEAGLNAEAVQVCTQAVEAAEKYQVKHRPGDRVLIKGSRAMKMEEAFSVLVREK